jgi:hypothetical protein
MRIKKLSKKEKRERVQEIANKLVRDAIIAIPPGQWTSEVQEAGSERTSKRGTEKKEERESSEIVVETKDPEEGGGAESPPGPKKEVTEDEEAAQKESAILRRLGFILIAYRIEYWWWEGMEMFRKFLMTWSSLSTALSAPPFPSRLAPPCPASPPALLVRLTPFLGFFAAVWCVLLHILIYARLVSPVGNQLIKSHSHAHDSFLVFLPTDGPAQLATGALITFIFLFLNQSCQPFCTDTLNRVQAFSLVAQFITLFCGILIGWMAEMDSSKGSDASEEFDDNGFFGYTIVLINCTTLLFPLIRKVMTTTQNEMMENLNAVAMFPVACYIYMCGGQKRLNAKIAKKRAEPAARAASYVVQTEVVSEIVREILEAEVVSEAVKEILEAAARDSTSRCARAAVFAAPAPHAAPTRPKPAAPSDPSLFGGANAAADQAADRACAMTAAKSAPAASSVGPLTPSCLGRAPGTSCWRRDKKLEGVSKHSHKASSQAHNRLVSSVSTQTPPWTPPSLWSTSPIEVQSSTFLQNDSINAELGFVTMRDTKQVDIADSAAGVLVQQADDSEDETTAGSKRIVEAVLAESMARLPAHMRMIDCPPSLQQWYLSNKKPDSSDESLGSKRERPILQSRPWGN